MEDDRENTKIKKCKVDVAEDTKNIDDNNIKDSTDKKNYSCDYNLPYDIWRLIFKYLNGRDLSTASMVCRTWKEAIESELALHEPQYLLAESSDFKTPQLKCFVNKINVKPKTALFFCESIKLMAELKSNTASKACICSQLPHNCDIIYTETPAADLCTKSRIQKQLPENAFRVGCLFYPNLPDSNTKVFHHLKGSKCSDSAIESLSQNILQHNKNEKKCLIMLCDDNTMLSMHKLLNNLKKNINNTTLSLIGGRTNDLYICKYHNDTNSRHCKTKAQIIAISISKPGMESWSIVIKMNCNKEHQIVAKLTEFREKIQLQKHTCGLMFGCCARIENKDVEMRAFKKVFPDVPVICGYGNEEFGVDTLEYNPTSKNKKNFYTNYSTIFTVITYL